MTRAANPLYISIPRKIDPSLRTRWDIVRACNGSRRKMVDYICGIGGIGGIGGYYDRHDRFAIGFNVKAYGADVSEENLWKKLTSGEMSLGPDTTLPAGEQAAVKALFSRVYKEHENNLWDWGLEEAYEGWRDSDTPYETWLGERVDWKFELRGRSGGHLVMTECEGLSLMCSPEDLEETLFEREDGEYCIGATVLRKLFIICVQNHFELTTTAAAEEVEYRAAWRLWASFMEDQIPAMLDAYRTRQNLAESAEAIAELVMRHGSDTGLPLAEHFKTICILADISIEE